MQSGSSKGDQKLMQGENVKIATKRFQTVEIQFKKLAGVTNPVMSR
jgi:hypothetical protein